MSYAPAPEPQAAGAISRILDPRATDAIPSHPGTLPGESNAHSDDLTTLKIGLDALLANDPDGARAVRDSLPRASLDRQILTWAIASQAGSSVSQAEIAAAMETLAGWPGMDALRRNNERAMLRERVSPATAVQAFNGTQPETLAGTILLARSLVALGDNSRAQAVLSPFWRTEKLSPSEEAAIIKEFGSLIPTADHRFRMERMLYAERVASAQRVAELAGAKALAEAWTAVIRGDKRARKLLDGVPEAQRSAGYLFAETRYLRRNEKFAEAAAIMLKAPTDKASLVDPDAWWIERRALARELADAKDIKNAYRIASQHAAESPANAVDAEFHAGWFALRALDDPQAAAKHFSKIAQIADGPISRSRAYYWLGRTAEASGAGDAGSYYALAATYGTAFYGQLAAARIGRGALPIVYPTPSEADRKIFASREAVDAIRRLEQAGYASQAEILYRHLAEELTSPGELALLAAMAKTRGKHFLALRIAKTASGQGIDIGTLSHPIGAIPGSAGISGTGKALAYAVARQESEFNAAAVSGAGARGLLQLLPRTAKEVAKKSGLPYSQSRLTSDAGYNAALGAAFLDEQLGRFDGSYVLTFAGYNAGPGRALEWIKRYGDPREMDIDAVVDWIERIPFAETRSYVQRVMENYQVYKARLSGRSDIAADLTRGR
ncbi:MAG TPA: lytic transglycosylase domain-containing protein [Mesorhizobium sp.]|nr:lytic transglycosylase domain-containing protein [Mesorhizobium sp.]